MSNYRDALEDVIDLIDDNFSNPTLGIKKLRALIVELLDHYDYDQANAGTNRIRWTDALLQDVAQIVTNHPYDWVNQLKTKYRWTSSEHCWRIKGEAVTRGYLPAVTDGRGRKVMDA